jgi:hypothetical protein
MAEELNSQEQFRRQLLRWKILAGSLVVLCVLGFVLMYPWKGSGNDTAAQVEKLFQNQGKPVPGLETPPPGFKATTHEERIEELRRWGWLTPEIEADLRAKSEFKKKFREEQQAKAKQGTPAPK